MIVLFTAIACFVALLLPAMITGDWHKDRMDRIERGEC